MERNKTILVIDNDKAFTSLIMRFLQGKCGYEVKIVSNGYDGIIMAKKLKPAIVLLDIRMPATNGLGVLEELKSNAETYFIPVIILTGFDDDEIRNNALALKAADYLTKPISLDVLREKIAAALSENNPQELGVRLPCLEQGPKSMENKSIKVLLIEDDPSAAALYQKIFRATQKTSFDVRWADNLAKALKYEKYGTFDVILLDLNLPDSSGFDTFAKVKEAARNTPIIILTGLEDEELEIRTAIKGARNYITKAKFENNMFLRAITHAIERNQI